MFNNLFYVTNTEKCPYCDIPAWSNRETGQRECRHNLHSYLIEHGHYGREPAPPLSERVRPLLQRMNPWGPANEGTQTDSFLGTRFGYVVATAVALSVIILALK